MHTLCAIAFDPMTHTGIATSKSIKESWKPEEPHNDYLAEHWSKHPAFNFSSMDGNSEKASDDEDASPGSSGATEDEDSSSSRISAD